jgi:adenylate cyclase
MSTGTQRRLAAILAADVVGYSRLMGQDETGTLDALRKLRAELLDPKIAQHTGRVFKSTGDGLLAEFPSVVNAVACAIEIQHGVSERSFAAADDRAIRLRVGINLGDVVVEDGDVFGDGVNVAARIEGVAPPGGIAVTETVRDHLGSRLDVQFADLGEQRFKNIDRAIRVYQVQNSGDKVPTQSIVQPSATERPSIAVLPFTNMSGDPSQEYFSDGVTEDIITELSRFRSLRVIARNSSFRFRGRDVDVVQVGRHVGAQFVLEGSVRKIGRKIRITTQLIDAGNNSHIWAERFDRDQEEIFAVQDEVVSTIVGTLAGQLEAASAEKARRKPPSSLAAYDCVLRADALPVSVGEAREEARRLAERAIELDPSYGRAYAQLAITYHLEWVHSSSRSDEPLEKALELGQKALSLDEGDSTIVGNLAWIYMLRRSYELSEHYFKRALVLNPNKPSTLAALGALYGFVGRADEGIALFKQAKLVDPYYDPTWYWPQLGIIYFITEQYDAAIGNLIRSPTMPAWVHIYLAACYALTDRMDEAMRAAQQARKLAPDLSIGVFAEKEPFKSTSDRDRLLGALRKCGLPE